MTGIRFEGRRPCVDGSIGRSPFLASVLFARQRCRKGEIWESFQVA